jgi:hypothetical protein
MDYVRYFDLHRSIRRAEPPGGRSRSGLKPQWPAEVAMLPLIHVKARLPILAIVKAVCSLRSSGYC